MTTKILKLFFFCYSLLWVSLSFAAVPDIDCGALPWCGESNIESWDAIYGVLWNIVALLIQYVAVIAVLAVMVGWIMYLISSGDEERIKKAKNVIIWALVWVFISVAAFWIINIINNFRV